MLVLQRTLRPEVESGHHFGPFTFQAPQSLTYQDLKYSPLPNRRVYMGRLIYFALPTRHIQVLLQALQESCNTATPLPVGSGVLRHIYVNIIFRSFLHCRGSRLLVRFHARTTYRLRFPLNVKILVRRFGYGNKPRDEGDR